MGGDGRGEKGKEGAGRDTKNGGKSTRVTLVGISLDFALCDFQVALVGYLVEGVLAAAEDLAGVAVAVVVLGFYLVLSGLMHTGGDYGRGLGTGMVIGIGM